MNPVRRWLRFNVVGVAGMLVQLVTLAGLNHVARGHYLLISAVAVETAILHNFVAHVHYTWHDRRLREALHSRRGRVALLGALWRFQVSNGGVSLVGSLLLMRLLVGAAHVPVLAANVVSIGVCGLVNFWLGDRWAFAPQKRRRSSSKTGVWCRAVAVLLVVMQVGMAVGQETAPPAQASGSVTLTPAAQKVKDDVGRIHTNGKMTVWMLDGIEYHGRLEAIEPDHFVLREVDLSQTITVRYADVRAVTPNYGGKGFGGHRVDPRRSAIIGAALVVGLLTLVLVAVASDKS